MQNEQSVTTTASISIEALAQHSSSRIRAVLAASPETPAPVLRILATDIELSLKMAAILNTECPMDVLEEMSQDPDPKVRLGLANQLDMCDEILSALLTHRNPYVAVQAKYALAASVFERKLKELGIRAVSGCDHKLGELLVRAQQLVPENLNAALELGRQQNLRLGRVLLQAGLVSASVLIESLRLQALLRQKEIEEHDAIQTLRNGKFRHSYQNKYLD